MGFSTMLLSVVMEHPLVKIYMASLMKIAASHNWDGGGGGWSLPHYRPAGKCLRNFQSSLMSDFSSGFDYIHFRFGSGGDATLLRVLAVVLFLKLCRPSGEPAAAELLQHCKMSSTSAPISAVASVKKWYLGILLVMVGLGPFWLVPTTMVSRLRLESG